MEGGLLCDCKLPLKEKLKEYFSIFCPLKTPILTYEKHYGRLRSSPVHLHSGFRVLYWLPRSPSLKESIKPWDLTAVGLFLLSPTAVKLQGGYHRGATSTLCGRAFYYIQKGIPALPARTLSRWLGDPSKGASPPGSLFTNNIYKQYLQTHQGGPS